MTTCEKAGIFKSKKFFSVSKHPLPPPGEQTCVSKHNSGTRGDNSLFMSHSSP